MKKNHTENKSSLSVSKKWLDFAEEDQQVVELLWSQDSTLFRTICFHAQQYVEKILKGIIDNKTQKPPRIHDINALVEKCTELGVAIPLNETEILFLSSIYIDVRYPPDVGLLPSGEPLKSDADLAVNTVRKLRKWVNELKQPPSVKE